MPGRPGSVGPRASKMAGRAKVSSDWSRAMTVEPLLGRLDQRQIDILGTDLDALGKNMKRDILVDLLLYRVDQGHQVGRSIEVLAGKRIVQILCGRVCHRDRDGERLLAV